MASEKQELTVGEFIAIMQGAQKQYWEWENSRNTSLFRLGFNNKQSKEFRDACAWVITFDKIFRNSVNKPRKNGKPSTVLENNPELDGFLGVELVVWPRVIIDYTRRLPLYSLQKYQENQSGGSNQEKLPEDYMLMAIELQETVNESMELLNNSSISDTEFNELKNMIPSSGGKRNSRRRNKRKSSSKKAKKSRRHRH